jgi:hypothetical protein
MNINILYILTLNRVYYSTINKNILKQLKVISNSAAIQIQFRVP